MQMCLRWGEEIGALSAVRDFLAWRPGMEVQFLLGRSRNGAMLLLRGIWQVRTYCNSRECLEPRESWHDSVW